MVRKIVTERISSGVQSIRLGRRAIPLYLKNDTESESVNIIDGVVYVTSNAGRRAYLYRVDFSAEE